jgi:phenylacetic acid degradation operon negative regulatory protein
MSVAPSPLEARIAAFRQLGRMQAGSLIITVFGDTVLPRGGRIWLGSLIQLLEPLGLNERLVRTSVFRLVKDEWLASEAQGRRTDYRLTTAGQRRFEEASRQIYAAETAPWDRRWRLVLVVGELDARAREKLRRALFWQGFGDLGAGSFIHPSADLRQVFDALATDGMSALLPALMPLLAANPRLAASANDSDMVRRAWNLADLASGYQAFVQRYAPVLDALQRTDAYHPDDLAWQVRLLLIHDFRRLLLRDPELPDVLLPRDWPGHQARALCKDLYCRLLEPSERHLDATLRLASGDTPTATPWLLERFRHADPLVAVP